jgi:hypothetical protein
MQPMIDRIECLLALNYWTIVNDNQPFLPVV